MGDQQKHLDIGSFQNLDVPNYLDQYKQETKKVSIFQKFPDFRRSSILMIHYNIQ